MQPLRINIFSTKPPARAKDLEPFFGVITSDGTWLRKPTWFEFNGPSGPCRITVSGSEFWDKQRDGLKGYASNFLDVNDPFFNNFCQLVDQLVSAYAFLGDFDIKMGDNVYHKIEKFASSIDGIIFAWDSFIIPEKGVLFGPLAAEDDDKESPQTATEEQLQGVVRTSRDYPNPTEHQLARRSFSIKIIRDLGLPVLDSLPVIEEDKHVTVRTPEDIARRLLCIAICAVKAEQDDKTLIDHLIATYQVHNDLTDEEKTFIQESPSSDRKRAKFSWRYECAHVLQWALGIESDLLPAHKTCDAATVVGHIKDKTIQELSDQAQPQSTASILNAADLYYRLHWAAIELRLKNKKHPAIDGGVVVERHYALNWLIRYQNADWDSVPTDT